MSTGGTTAATSTTNTAGSAHLKFLGATPNLQSCNAVISPPHGVCVCLCPSRVALFGLLAAWCLCVQFEPATGLSQSLLSQGDRDPGGDPGDDLAPNDVLYVTDNSSRTCNFEVGVCACVARRRC